MVAIGTTVSIAITFFIWPGRTDEAYLPFSRCSSVGNSGMFSILSLYFFRDHKISTHFLERMDAGKHL